MGILVFINPKKTTKVTPKKYKTNENGNQNNENE